jgi:ABC-2 type transport system ATP-binding protein
MSRRHAIAVRGLTKRFNGVVALEDVDFDVAAGTVFGLLGPNGAGKTTAIRVLTTILRPDAGRAEVLGADVTREPAAVRKLIGLAGQFAAVDPNLTGRENLRLMGRLSQLRRREYRPRVEELLDRFELDGAASRPVRTYSGGMRRRLDVAAALVARPPVLFLDEPTTGLDPHSRNELWDLIRELVADGTTVLLTTQYLDEADRLTDRVAVIDRGRVIANDTPAALKTELGTTVIRFDLGDVLRAERAARVACNVVHSRVERNGTSLQLATSDSSRALIRTLHALDAEGLAPMSVEVREPTLDDVFLILTGQRSAPVAPQPLTSVPTGNAP